MSFELHPRLAADTDLVGDLPLCRVLLAKENIGPWLVLVPRRPSMREVHHLPEPAQIELMRESATVASLLETTYGADKINIAALGNMVPQLHVHHVARFEGDAAWPRPIWGNTPGTLRDADAQAALLERLRVQLAAYPGFVPARA